MSEADELLRRLVEWQDIPSDGKVHTSFELMPLLATIIADARAYLARPKGPVAEGTVRFAQGNNGWLITTGYNSSPPIRVRIPVPTHLVSPPVIEGEVVEGSDA